MKLLIVGHHIVIKEYQELWVLYHISLRIAVFAPVTGNKKVRAKVSKHRAVLRYLLSRNSRSDSGGSHGL